MTILFIPSSHLSHLWADVVSVSMVSPSLLFSLQSEVFWLVLFARERLELVGVGRKSPRSGTKAPEKL